MFTRRSDSITTVRARARADRRTKNLVKRLEPGDVAVIDHDDIDRVAAESLIAARVGGIVNAGQSISGRYPNVGPLLLAAAGIPIVDGIGREAFDRIAEGSVIEVDGDRVIVDGVEVGRGTAQTLETLELAYDTAKVNLGAELERFAENTLDYMRRERHLMLDSPELPVIDTKIEGRHVLIVVRGHDYHEDLMHLRSYVREMRPVLIGVDGGADALLESGLKPDIIIGDFDSVSSDALETGAELIVHAYADGEAPGAARLVELGVPFRKFVSAGTSEDIAMILAYEKGAELIVAVGTHASMIEFLDKGRAGMASTFLVRLKVGPILVDAKGVSRLYQSRVRKSDLSFLLLSALLAFVVMFAVSYPLRSFVSGLWFVFSELWSH